MPRLSIVTVCFNAADDIERTIHSVIDQDYDDYEYIIIDGGSTDGTVDIIRNYSKLLSFWVSEKDEGVYDAMNKGISHAKGEYIGFINSGDYYVSTAFRVVDDYIKNTEADVLYGGVFDNKSGKWEKKFPLPLETIYQGMPFCHQSCFVKMFDGMKFDVSYRISADYKFFLQLFLQRASFFFIYDVLAYYTRGGISSDYLLMCKEQVDIALDVLSDADNEYERYNNLFSKNKIFNTLDEDTRRDLINEFIRRTFPSDAEYVVWGVGKLLEQYSDIMGGLNIRYLIDLDVAKQGNDFIGYRVESPECLDGVHDIYLFIASEIYENEIMKNVNNMDIDSSNTIITYKQMKNAFYSWLKEEL